MTGASGFALDPDGGERLVFGEVTILVRASAETTGGAFSLFEEVPPLVDTPLHVHENEDELFYALEGEHVIQVADEEIHLRPGGLVFGPRGVPHAQRRVVPGAGRHARPHVAGRVRRLLPRARGGTRGRDARSRRYAAASEKYRITWLG